MRPPTRPRGQPHAAAVGRPRTPGRGRRRNGEQHRRTRRRARRHPRWRGALHATSKSAAETFSQRTRCQVPLSAFWRTRKGTQSRLCGSCPYRSRPLAPRLCPRARRRTSPSSWPCIRRLARFGFPDVRDRRDPSCPVPAATGRRARRPLRHGWSSPSTPAARCGSSSKAL